MQIILTNLSKPYPLRMLNVRLVFCFVQLVFRCFFASRDKSSLIWASFGVAPQPLTQQRYLHCHKLYLFRSYKRPHLPLFYFVRRHQVPDYRSMFSVPSRRSLFKFSNLLLDQFASPLSEVSIVYLIDFSVWAHFSETLASFKVAFCEEFCFFYTNSLVLSRCPAV